jgi:putative glycosyltransferase (TIGR04372 family)
MKSQINAGEVPGLLTWRKGWSDGEPFVCLLVRDDEYLAHGSLHGNGNPRAYEGWSYHNYRNSDIDTYLPAIGWLAAQGVWVIRMGKLMAKPLPTGIDHVVDYSFDPGKSDLLDIWLLANCTGCISTATGPDQISLIFERATLFVNALPLSHLSSSAKAIWVPKPLRWRDSGQPLSITEHLTHGFTRSVEYNNAGIDILDMTSSEITSAVQEFWERITETWLDVHDDLDRQAHFWDVLMRWPLYPNLHSARHPEARVGSAWLRTLDEMDSSSNDL